MSSPNTTEQSLAEIFGPLMPALILTGNDWAQVVHNPGGNQLPQPGVAQPEEGQRSLKRYLNTSYIAGRLPKHMLPSAVQGAAAHARKEWKNMGLSSRTAAVQKLQHDMKMEIINIGLNLASQELKKDPTHTIFLETSITGLKRYFGDPATPFEVRQPIAGTNLNLEETPLTSSSTHHGEVQAPSAAGHDRHTSDLWEDENGGTDITTRPPEKECYEEPAGEEAFDDDMSDLIEL